MPRGVRRPIEQLKEEGGPLAARVLELMHIRGLSARGLSLQAKLAPDAVRNITRGKAKNPTLPSLRALATALRVPLEALEDPTSPLPELNAPPPGPPASQSASVIAPTTIEVPEVDLAALNPDKPGGLLALPSIVAWRLPAEVFGHLGYGARPVALLAPNDLWSIGIRRGDRILVDALAVRVFPGQVVIAFDYETGSPVLGEVVPQRTPFPSSNPDKNGLLCAVSGRAGPRFPITAEPQVMLGRVLGRLGLMDTRTMRTEATAAREDQDEPRTRDRPTGDRERPHRRLEPTPAQEGDEV